MIYQLNKQAENEENNEEDKQGDNVEMEDNDAVPIEKADQSDDISAKINTLPKALRLSLS